MELTGFGETSVSARTKRRRGMRLGLTLAREEDARGKYPVLLGPDELIAVDQERAFLHRGSGHDLAHDSVRADLAQIEPACERIMRGEAVRPW